MRRSTRRCRPSAGTAPTARATSCGSTARACSSRVAPTTRSRSAAGASSSARSSRRCRRCPPCRPRRSPCSAPRRACQLLVGYVVGRPRVRPAAARAELADELPAPLDPAARGRRRAAGAHVRQGRQGRAARGRCPASDAATPRARGHRGLARRAVAGGARHRPCPTRTRTSSSSAAARSPPRSWSRASAPAPRSSRWPTSTTFRVCGQMADARRGRGVRARRRAATRSASRARRRGSCSGCRRSSGVPLFIFAGLRWTVWLLTASWILRAVPGLRLPARGAAVAASSSASSLFVTPFGRMATSAAVARLLLGGLKPGDYPRGGGVHLRLWLAEQVAHQVDPVGLAGAPWVSLLRPRARARRSARTSTCTRFRRSPACSRSPTAPRSSPRSTSSGYWIDGDTVRIGGISIGAGATIGTRSTLAPGTRIGSGAEIAPGIGRLRPRARRPALGGLPRRPRRRHRRARSPPSGRPRRRAGSWAYGASSRRARAAAVRRDRRGRRRARRGHPRRRASIGEAVPARARRGSCPATLVVGVVVRRRRRAARAAAVDRARRGGASGAQPRGVAGVDDRAAAGLGAHDPVPAVLEPVHARCGCACSAPRSAVTSRRRRSCSSRR